ncbi:MAG: hypothetical protein QOG11_620 [Solirubrobacteraceae bacterium]|jgi:hypothetical protein|nr:hypothetical protein [Solirubrobacteraceae bacterium]
MVAMADSRRAQRTLVKSPPELWAEVSDSEALGRHLEPFGEIRITRLEPETTVAWEGDRARGTVELEAAGWGTRVTITATADGSDAEDQAAPAAAAPDALTTEIDAISPGIEAIAPEPEAVTQGIEADATQAATTRRGWLRRLFGGRRRREDAPIPEASIVEPPLVAVAEPEPEPAPPPAPAPAASLAAVETAGPPLTGADAEGILAAVLDDLGAAHHRPFSR